MKAHTSSNNSIFRIIAAILATIAAFSVSAFSQFDSGTLLGSVRDSASAALPSATVKLQNIETNITTTLTTDSSGNFQFTNVRIGRYKLTAEAAGFSSAVAENIQVTVNSRQSLNMVLTAGEVTEVVTIEASPELLETNTSDRGQIISREQIVNLPLNGRAYADLALLSTGVNQSMINVPGRSGSRDASFNVNGLRSSLNNFIIDGVDNNAYGTSNQGFSNQVVQASPDALQEFKVQTNNFSAEFGRAGGAVINASIRSGTNRFSGSAWNYMRNTAFNATGFFKPTNNEKPVLIQNQFGGTFGGPILKDKLFFFMDYEGYRRIAKQVAFANLPTVAQRQGILAVDVRDPFTGVVYNAGTPIPMTAFAQKVLNDLPLPNASGSNNYVNLPRSQFFTDKGNIKLDYTVNDKMTAFVRGSMFKTNNFEAPTVLGPSGGNSNSSVFVINEQLAGGVTYNLTPVSILEFRLGISRTKAGKSPYNVGAGNMMSIYGIPGLPEDPAIAGGLNSQGVSGFTQFGRQNSNPQFQNPTVINPRINFTNVRGRHSLKFGYEYQAISTDISDSHPKYGIDSYGGQFTRISGAANNLYNLADFMFGLRSSYQLTDTFVAKYRQRMNFMYVQDDFQVTPDLTLNLGLRYEYATPQFEAQNRLSNFDPNTNTIINATDGSIADRATVKPDKNNFAPRFGIAWKFADKFVLRGGYGISYIHFNRLGGENILSLNPPQVFNVNIDNNIANPLCTGQNFTGCFRTTGMGYPTGMLDPSQFQPLRSRVNFTPYETPTGYVQSYHATVQYEILKDLLLDFGYIGNRSRDLIILGDHNMARPNNPGETLTVQQRRPISQFGFIQKSFAGGKHQYDSFQFKVERRFRDGLYLLNSFTYSAAYDNASGHLETGSGDNSRANLSNLAGDWGRSSYDIPVNNTTSVVWDLPIGKGKWIGSNMPGWLDAVIGGFRMTTVNRITSGRPINLTYSPSSTMSVGGDVTYRPNVNGEVVNSNWTPQSYFNPAAVSVPTDVSQPFGNAKRNSVRGPGFWQADVGLHKNFRLWNEFSKLEFRAEAFNLFNKTNFGQPNSNITSNTFGTITSAFPARELQFAVKLYF